MPNPKRKIFISYAHEDAGYKEELVKHLATLKHQGWVETWDDGAILPGGEWDDAIHSQLAQADIILLLASGDFNASDYIYSRELQLSMARHERQEAVVIPVLLRTSDWQNMPYGILQALPPGGLPISKWEDPDEAFVAIAQGIRRVIENGQKTATPPASTITLTSPYATATGQATSVPLPPIPGLSGLDYSHALRPAFTESVVRMLFLQRQSVNLIAPQGWGGDRLLEDLGRCHLPDTRVLEVNMKNYVSSYTGFMQDLALQLGIPATQGARIGAFLPTAVEQLSQRLLLCLRNFDTLLDDPEDLDPAYDDTFLNQLNALRHQPNIRLICQTQRLHNQCNFRGRTSWLTLEPMRLRELSAAQMEAEIERNCPLPPALKTYLVEQLEADIMPYAVLHQLINRLAGEGQPVKEGLRDHLKQIRKDLYGYGRR